MAIDITGTQFEKYKDRIAKEAFWIVHITDGTNNWYFSTTNMNLTDVTVYPLLASEPSITEEINVYTKRWAVSDVSFNLSNIPYKVNSSNVWVRPSDELNDQLVGSDLKVYYALGGDITQLSDAMLRFSGTILVHPEYDEDIMSVSGIDKGRLKHKELPTETVGDVFSTKYYKNQTFKIPLVYGKFTFDIDELTGDGLAVAVPYDLEDSLVSMRPLHAITEYWFKKPQIPDICKYNSPNLDTAYSTNYGRARANYGYDLATAYLYPVLGYDIGDYNYGNISPGNIVKPTNHENAFDRDLTTTATQTDAYDNILGTQEGVSVFVLPDYSGGEANRLNNSIGRMSGNIYIDAILTHIAGVDATYARLLYDHNLIGTDYGVPSTLGDAVITPSSTTWDSGFFDSGATSFTNIDSFAKDVGWHFASGSTNSSRNTDTGILLIIHSVNNEGGDNVANNTTLHTIYQVRVRVQFYPDYRDVDKYFVACEGEEYDTWISSRSSNYASGDVIEDPSGIVESILRNDLGLSSSDLDLVSFIDAENTSMKHRVNIHEGNKTTSDIIIRKICEQSTFAFYFSGVSKAKLIPLNDTSPTTTATIHYTHILGGRVKVGKSSWLINRISAKSRYQQEKGQFADVDVDEDTTSQGWYGIRNYDAEWDYISGTSTTHLLRHLVNSFYQGFWARLRNEIELTIHSGYAYLEVGDWIELDDTTVDPHIKCYGTSWTGKQFLITKIQVTDNGVFLRGLEVS